MKCNKNLIIHLYLIFSLLTASVILTIIFSIPDKTQFEKIAIIMDTSFKIKVDCLKKDSTTCDSSIDSIFNELMIVEKRYDFYSDQSYISLLNNEDTFFIEDTSFLNLIEDALTIKILTKNAFDPCIGQLTQLWNISNNNGYIPPDDSIRLVMDNLRFSDSIFLSDNMLIKNEQILFDLGGIVKGYALKKTSNILDTLHKKGIVSEYLIDAGRSIKGLSSKASLKIGIAHPRKNSELFGWFEMPPEYTCASCGDYERFFIKDGVRYHHIFDPKTGYPAKGVVATTVICKDPVLCDALSTAVFVMGVEDGIKFLNNSDDVSGIIMYIRSDSLYYTASNGFYEKFNLHIMEDK